MGKASRTKVEATRREKIAAQRAAEHRAEQRRRILLASGAVVVVLAIVLTFVIIKLNNKPTAPAASPSASASPQGLSNGPTGSALAPVVDKVTSVPASTLDTVGKGGFTGKVQTLTGNPKPLTANGKPELLYVGAEFCPYCGAMRWAMIVALSRFGTFTGLATVHSAVSNGAGGAGTGPGHADLDLPARQLLQPVPELRLGRGDHQHPGPVDRELHPPADPDLGPECPGHQVSTSRPTSTRPGRYRSSISATST